MHQQPMTFLIRNFITKGITGAVVLYFLILGLIGLQMNTMMAQSLIKLLVVFGVVIWGNSVLEKHFQEVAMFHRFLFGVGAGFVMAVVLLAFEAVTLSIGNVALAPTLFQTLEAPQFLLSIALAFELIGFGLLGALAALQYFKKPRRKIQASQVR